jgi:hypothetical protein
VLAFLCALLFMSPRTVDVRLGPVQKVIVREIRDPHGARFLDVEGALRSAKTWTTLIAIRTILEEYPGIYWAMARWTEGDLNQKLIPDWRHVCALMEIPYGTWNARESCYDLANGSRLYCVHLKTSQRDNRYATVRGLTVAGFYIDQLEEVPEDVANEAALRLSQPGYPQKMVVTPNPVPENHWIAQRWPVANNRAQHRYIRVAMKDNAHNLDAGTIAAAELLYPDGHPQRRVKILGMRGLDVHGKPVYLGAFVRERHVAADLLPLNLQLPLYEAYDYGFHHPCVLWYQWAPWGQLCILGGVMGSDLHLDAFLPIVERYRSLWFPQHPELRSTCDPAGANENSQGLRGTPVGVLQDWYREHGERDASGQYVVPQYAPDANMPERRAAANQRAATYMRRRVHGVEAFQVDPERWALVALNEEKFDSFFIDGLEAGYVLEDEARHSGKLGSFWVPKKDGWFEHPQNCFEYGVQAHVLDLPLSDEHSELAKARHVQQQVREAQRQLRAAQKDVDVDDLSQRTRVGRSVGRVAGASRRISRRGGY